MKEQVEEFLANLISIGFTKENACEKAYEYAIALQADSVSEIALRAGAELVGPSVTSTMMSNAASLVAQALPGAYRIYEIRNRMH